MHSFSFFKAAEIAVWQTFLQFTCSFPDKKQIRIVKGEKNSDYLFPVNIDPKYTREKLSVIKGETDTWVDIATDSQYRFERKPNWQTSLRLAFSLFD